MDRIGLAGGGLVLKPGVDTAVLRDKVTSPGARADKGVQQVEQDGVGGILMAAAAASAISALELAP